MKTPEFEIEKGILIEYRGQNKNVIIPNSIMRIGAYAFYNCSSVTSITIPDSVTSIGDYAFYGCGSLTSVTIGYSVTVIGNWAFDCCIGLKSIIIPNSVVSINKGAFYNCGINEIMLSKELALLIELNPENYEGLLDHKEKFKLV